MKPIFKAQAVKAPTMWMTGSYFNAATGPTIIRNKGADMTDFVFVIVDTICQQTDHSINGVPVFVNDIIRFEEADEQGNPEFHWVFITWIKEWSMVAVLTEYERLDYEEFGVDKLDEVMFWSYPLQDNDWTNPSIVGNIYDKEHGTQSWIEHIGALEESVYAERNQEPYKSDNDNDNLNA